MTAGIGSRRPFHFHHRSCLRRTLSEELDCFGAVVFGGLFVVGRARGVGPAVLQSAASRQSDQKQDSAGISVLDDILCPVDGVRPEAVTDYVITPHAAFEMQRRGIPEDVVRSVLTRPEQRFEVWLGRVILQSRVEMPKTHLVRVFVDVDRRPAEVVTVYRGEP